MRSLWLAFALCMTSNLFAQSTITVKYYGLTIHPFGDETAHLQPRKLDNQARLVLNHGVFVGYERYLNKNWISVKTIQGLFRDCSNGIGFVSHIGGRATLYDSEKHRFAIGVGPTFIARESWRRFGPTYRSSGFFNESTTERWGPVQWKFAVYSVDLEYDFKLSAKDNLSISLTPGIPLANICSIGWKHIFGEFDLRPPSIYVPKP